MLACVPQPYNLMCKIYALRIDKCLMLRTEAELLSRGALLSSAVTMLDGTSAVTSTVPVIISGR